MTDKSDFDYDIQKIKYILDKTVIKDKGDCYKIEYVNNYGRRIYYRRTYVKKIIKEKAYDDINKIRKKLIKKYIENIDKNIKIEYDNLLKNRPLLRRSNFVLDFD